MFYNTFEGGAAGTNITTANSGGASGDAFSFIIVQGANAGTGSANAQYVSTHPAKNGSLSLQFTLGASSSYVGWTESASANRFVVEFPIYFPALPSAAVVLATIRHASGTMTEARLATTGRVQAYAQTSSVTGALSNVLSPNTLYWGQLAVTKETATGAGNGLVELRILNADRSVNFTSTATATLSTTPNNAAQYRIGGATSASGWTTLFVDDAQAGALASGWPDELVFDDPPTIDVTEGSYYVADFTGSTEGSGGAIAFTIAYTSGENNSAGILEPINGLFLIPQTQAVSTYTVTATDTTGTYDTVVSVPPLTVADTVQRSYFDGTVWS